MYPQEQCFVGVLY